jgi:List-Bact-rpt repeat protein/PASTA domain-containing protein
VHERRHLWAGSADLRPTELNFSDSTYHNVSINLFEVSTGAAYCARLVANSGGGEAWGDFLTFTVDKPGAVTDHASSTGGPTATVYGVVNPNGQTTTYEAQYDVATSTWCTSGGASGSPQTSLTNATLGFTDEQFHDVTVDLTGLTPTTVYCARLVATNPNGTVHGNQVTWTQGSAPDALTYDTYSTGATTATVEGTVDPHTEDTTYVAQWDLASSAWCMSGGISGSPAHTTPGTDPIPSDDFVSIDLSALSEHGDYCAKLVATDANGVSEGGVVTWTQGMPTAETFDGFATGVSTARVEGDVNPAGKPTTYELQYDLSSSTWCQSGGTSGSPAHTTATGSLAADGTFHDATTNLTGLATNASYCGQFVATNADGTSDGGQVYWAQPTTFTLTVTFSSTFGYGTGTVTSSPAGIDCGAGGSTCSYAFPAGSDVTLTATPTAGSTFQRFIGGPCNGPGTCTITMDTDRTVSAVFAGPSSYTLTVSRAGSGSGTVTSSPAGISCGSTCSHAFAVRSNVALTATPASGSTFTGWSGACTGTGTCSVGINAARTVTATFTAIPPPRKPVQCVVPKLKGKKLAAAKTSLRKHHCGVGKITRVKSTARNKGRVVAEKPKLGRHLRKGAKIALKIGK